MPKGYPKPKSQIFDDGALALLITRVGVDRVRRLCDVVEKTTTAALEVIESMPSPNARVLNDKRGGKMPRRTWMTWQEMNAKI